MRLLCIDHGFAQDIEAMQESAGSNHCWSIPFERFFTHAAQIFDAEVLTGLEAYFKPEHAAARERYSELVLRKLERLYSMYRFDAVLAPSDTFFWIRAVTRACQALGIPMVVLQKEATIPPGWLEGPAREWCDVSPFIADHMLVSSENHRRFWLNGGVDPDIVTVTGQPRFDLYARPERWRGVAEPGIELDGKPTVLFLTYDLNVYLPIIDRTGLKPWRELRADTEQVLVDVARRGLANVLIKSHPQPGEDQTAHLERLAENPGVFRVDPRADVRHHIAASDVVVGYQTTALMEALAAGRHVVYTWWTEPTREFAHDLIPFHEEGEALDIARSPVELERAIERGLREPTRAGFRNEAARQLVERFLGPIDGRAGERCWAMTETVVARTAPTPARQRLDRRRRVLRLPFALGAAASASVWSVACTLGPLGYPAYRLLSWLRRRRDPLTAPVFRRELNAQRRRARERLVAAATG
jgi:hypothetical protein